MERLGSAMLVMLTTVVVACSGDSRPGARSDEAQVRRLFEDQVHRIRDENWRDLYKHLSPTYKEACPYDEFLSLFSQATEYVDMDRFGFDEVAVSVDGELASVTYIVTYEGKDTDAVTEASPDLFVKIDGQWYDEYDEHGDCSG